MFGAGVVRGNVASTSIDERLHLKSEQPRNTLLSLPKHDAERRGSLASPDRLVPIRHVPC